LVTTLASQGRGSDKDKVGIPFIQAKEQEEEKEETQVIHSPYHFYSYSFIVN
jgi:hypothetical protein